MRLHTGTLLGRSVGRWVGGWAIGLQLLYAVRCFFMRRLTGAN